MHLEVVGKKILFTVDDKQATLADQMTASEALTFAAEIIDHVQIILQEGKQK